MSTTKEIAALLRLIDDPDDEVFRTVSQRIVGFGKEIVPVLEHLWEQSPEGVLQERLEDLVHQVHFEELIEAFRSWRDQPEPELFQGALLLCRYRYPQLEEGLLREEWEQIRRNTWIELNNYLTPLEQINVLNDILYRYYKLSGQEIAENDPNHFFVNSLLDCKKGNAFAMGLLILSLCDRLDLPLFAVDIPHPFLLAYVDTLFPFYSQDGAGMQQIQFFVDPIDGMVYTQNDVDIYLKKSGLWESEHSYYRILSTVEILTKCLRQLSACYRSRKEDNRAEDIEILVALLQGDG